MANAQITIVANANVTSAVQGFNQLNQAGQQAAATLNRVPNSAGRATDALNNLGRVAQDAPFGFIAISNNLNPLLESFQRLKTETGSTGGALKALVTSLTGAGGIGLALSAVTAALSFASIGFQAWTRGFSNSKKSTDEATKSVDEYVASLKKINSSLAEEATKVDVIVGSLNKGTLTRNEQKAAIKELISINPTYFGQLDQEKTSIDQLNIAYDKYIKNLNNQFAAKALEKQISDLFDKKLNITTALDQFTELQNQAKVLQDRLANLPKTLIGVRGGNPIFADTSKEAKLLEDQIKELQAEAFKFLQAFNKTGGSEELKFINSQIDILTAKRAALGNQGLIDPEKEKTALELMKEQRATLERQLKLLEEIDKAGKLPTFRQPEISDLQLRILKLDAIIDKLPAENVEIKKDIIEEALNRKLSATPLTIRPGNVVVDTGIGFEQADAKGEMNKLAANINTELALVGKELKPLQVIIKPDLDEKAINDFNNNLAKAIKNFEEAGLSQLGEVLGAAIVGGQGGLQDAMNGFVNVFGDFLQNIGKIAIQFGLQAQIIETAIKTLDPALAVVAGVALVALGAAVKGSMKKASPFADGGIVTSPTNAIIGEAGPEAIMPLNDINRFLGSVGNSAPQFVISDSRISGNDIVLAYNRTTKRINRAQ